MSTLIKACPFCGGKAGLFQSDLCDPIIGTVKKYTMWCMCCHARSADYELAAEASLAWNKRADQAANTKPIGKALRE